MQFYIPIVVAFLAGSTTAQIRRCPFSGGSIPFGQYVCSGPRVNGFPGNGIESRTASKFLLSCNSSIS
ncbi:hypothetical protein BHYA_0242g00170 [Botrytis hyacinthi]|uniref:Uncharacterized protein n=1 Tax=Botrytis hyacinthi TaxID=278943 RepID=A0A4Z1G972_9HELO|nr:hypothetical protein BHYA_0242g00170 [Botrytis hyacinthi]